MENSNNTILIENRVEKVVKGAKLSATPIPKWGKIEVKVSDITT